MGTPGGAEGRCGGEEIERAPVVVVGNTDEEEVKSMSGTCVVSMSSGGYSTMQNIDGGFGGARGLIQAWWTGGGYRSWLQLYKEIGMQRRRIRSYIT